MRTLILTATLLVALSPVSAHSIRSPFRLHERHEVDRVLERSPSPAPTPTTPPSGSEHVLWGVERRADTYTYNPGDSSAIPAITTITPSTANAAAPSATLTRAINFTLPQPPNPVPTSAPEPVPTPLDTTMYALSGQCLKYLTGLVSSSGFTSCLPFSLLLSASAAYKTEVLNATASGNYTHLNALIAYTNSPMPSPDQCDQNYVMFYSDISQKANCATELSAGSDGQAVARQAQRGLGNYQVMRRASGIVNPKTGVYCYLEALANDHPDDLYLWMLAAGNILPPSSTPTCSECSALLLNHIGSWASNTTTLNYTIVSSAISSINAKCGATFIAQPSPPPSTPSNNDMRISSCPVLMIALVAVSGILLL